MVSTVEDAGVTSTFSGSVSIELAKVSISGGIVAEKKSVCRFAGRSFSMRLMSWIKPMSSIRSASSKTKKSRVLSEMNPWVIKSNKRPGVATKICTPLRNASVWGFWPTPPNITACFSPVYRPYASKHSPIWMASSRVGVSINAFIPLRWSVLYSFCKIGIEKAAVFPVPVCAHPNKSFPWSKTGIDCSCMGVGEVYPSSWRALSMGSIRFKFSNIM